MLEYFYPLKKDRSRGDATMSLMILIILASGVFLVGGVAPKMHDDTLNMKSAGVVEGIKSEDFQGQSLIATAGSSNDSKKSLQMKQLILLTSTPTINPAKMDSIPLLNNYITIDLAYNKSNSPAVNILATKAMGTGKISENLLDSEWTDNSSDDRYILEARDKNNNILVSRQITLNGATISDIYSSEKKYKENKLIELNNLIVSKKLPYKTDTKSIILKNASDTVLQTFTINSESANKNVLGASNGKTDITFIPYNYSEDEMLKFRSLVERDIAHLKTFEPWKSAESYVNYNIYDHPLPDLTCNQYPDILSYCLDCNWNAAQNTLNNNGISFDHIVIIGNEEVRTGACAPGKNITNPSSLIGSGGLAHELGHAVGNLHHEDFRNEPGEITNQADKNCFKGIPPASDWEQIVPDDSYFKGCMKNNWYRSSNQSIMSGDDPYYSKVGLWIMRENLKMGNTPISSSTNTTPSNTDTCTTAGLSGNTWSCLAPDNCPSGVYYSSSTDPAFYACPSDKPQYCCKTTSNGGGSGTTPPSTGGGAGTPTTPTETCTYYGVSCKATSDAADVVKSGSSETAPYKSGGQCGGNYQDVYECVNSTTGAKRLDSRPVPASNAVCAPGGSWCAISSSPCQKKGGLMGGVAPVPKCGDTAYNSTEANKTKAQGNPYCTKTYSVDYQCSDGTWEPRTTGYTPGICDATPWCNTATATSGTGEACPGAPSAVGGNCTSDKPICNRSGTQGDCVAQASVGATQFCAKASACQSNTCTAQACAALGGGTAPTAPPLSIDIYCPVIDTDGKPNTCYGSSTCPTGYTLKSSSLAHQACDAHTNGANPYCCHKDTAATAPGGALDPACPATDTDGKPNSCVDKAPAGQPAGANCPAGYFYKSATQGDSDCTIFRDNKPSVCCHQGSGT